MYISQVILSHPGEALCIMESIALMHDSSSLGTLRSHYWQLVCCKDISLLQWSALATRRTWTMSHAVLCDDSKEILQDGWFPNASSPFWQVTSFWLVFIVNIFLPRRRGVLMLMSTRYVGIHNKYAYEYYRSRSECFCHAKSTLLNLIYHEVMKFVWQNIVKYLLRGKGN
jgi:hypothetical protein